MNKKIFKFNLIYFLLVMMIGACSCKPAPLPVTPPDEEPEEEVSGEKEPDEEKESVKEDLALSLFEELNQGGQK